jgi:SAM-dependent methyltransferase
VIKRAAKKFFPSPLWQSLRLGRHLQLQSTLFFKYYGAASSNVSTEKRLDFAHYRYLTEQIRAQIDFPSSPFYAFLKYREVDQLVRQWGGTSQRVLELGPGSTLGMLYCFLASGAQRAVGVDIAAAEKPAEFYQILHDYLACVAAIRWWRPFAADRSDPNIRYSKDSYWGYVDAQALLNRIEYFSPVGAHDLPFHENEFDLVYSCSAMEHFDRPREAMRQIRRVLAPGGLTIHEIDLRSHVAGGPLQHLRWSREEYDSMTQKYDPSHGIDKILQGEWTTMVYCNRLLAADWRRAFMEADLQTLQFEVISDLDPISVDPTQFAAPFSNQTQEELAPLIIRVVARKGASAPG